MAGIAASGGSTNGVLHLLAIAREAGVELTQDELTELAPATPVLASLSPGGRHVAETFHRAGGAPALIRELIAGGHLDGDAPTVAGPTLAEATAAAPAPDGDVLFPRARPYKPAGALRTLRGNLAPDGALTKLAGTERTRQTGPARVFDDEATCVEAVRAGGVEAGDVLVVRYEGPAGGPGHARDAERHLVRGRRRPRRVRRARHRRALLGRHARADGRPRRARGRARRPARGGARRRRDHDRHRHRRARASTSTPPSSRAGMAAWTPPAGPAGGVLAPLPRVRRLRRRRRRAGDAVMQALVLRPGEAGTTTVAEMPEPAPGPGQVLVRPVEVGVCGTDREISEGWFGIAPAGEERLILGHELLGRVERDGHGFARGDLVTATVRRSCGHCDACAARRARRVRDRRLQRARDHAPARLRGRARGGRRRARRRRPRAPRPARRARRARLDLRARDPPRARGRRPPAVAAGPRARVRRRGDRDALHRLPAARGARRVDDRAGRRGRREGAACDGVRRSLRVRARDAGARARGGGGRLRRGHRRRRRRPALARRAGPAAAQRRRRPARASTATTAT